MKRMICCLTCLLVLFSFVGCDFDIASLRSGDYYAVGDYRQGVTPYVCLDTSKNEFVFGEGQLLSHAEYGTYKVKEGKLIATSQNTTFEFEIRDQNTLVLIEGNDWFEIPVNAQFVFSKDFQ